MEEYSLKKPMTMDLTKELRQLSAATGKRIDRQQKAKKEKELADRAAYEKREADKILKALPGELRKHAKTVKEHKYLVFIAENLHSNAKSDQLTGMARLVFDGCKEMGLNVTVEPHGYDNGMTHDSCAGIFVCW